MCHVWSSSVLLLASVLFAHDAVAEGMPENLRRKEAKTLESVRRDLEKLGDWCVGKKAYRAACSEYRRILLIDPHAQGINEKILSAIYKSDGWKSGFDEAYQRKRVGTYKTCAGRLWALAKACESNYPAGFVKNITRAQLHLEGALDSEKLELRFFEPYLQWVRESDWVKLNKGREFVDGKWLTRAQVAEANAKHDSWKTAWIVEDGRIRVLRSGTLREVRTIFAHARANLDLALALYGAPLDLRAPDKPIELVHTKTQQRFRRILGILGGGRSTDVRRSSVTIGRTLVFTQQPRGVDGKTVTLPFNLMLRYLRRELVGHVLMTHTQHARGERSSKEYVSAIGAPGTMTEMFHMHDTGWRVMRKQHLPYRSVEWSNIAYVQKRIDELPTLGRLIPGNHPRRPDFQKHTGVMSCYFMFGPEPTYRRAWLELTKRSYFATVKPDTFAEVFAGIDLAGLQNDFRGFIEDQVVER